MGVTLESKNRSADFGYFGFYRLRRKVAELLDGKIGYHVGYHYEETSKPHFFENKQDEERFWKKYDERTDFLIEQTPKKYRKTFLFLYEPDVEGSVTYGTCKQVLDVIGDYDDDVKYGYAGRPDCATFKDFKELLRDCVETKTKLRWR